MGWQARVKEKKRKEIDRVLTKEEKLEIKRKNKELKESIKKEINEPIENIDERVGKSNINLLFLSFRPILFAAIGLFFMLIKKNYEFEANANIWPIIFFVVNVLTILLLIPLMRLQRISFKNVLKYKEKKFKWWQHILIILSIFAAFVIGSVIAELIAYGTIGDKTNMLLQSKFKIVDYFLLILLPLSTILAEDFFFYGYISNTVKNNIRNYILITIIAIVQHALFPFSFDLVFMGYRILSALIMFSLYTLIYRKTKNFIPIIVSHTILNLITMISIVLI